LADSLGAKLIDVYGADFSYPQGNSYARGTYIHKMFANKQNRFSSAESQFNYFLLRNISFQKVETDKTWYYETRMLNNYRRHFEKKISRLTAKVTQVEGIGAIINIEKNVSRKMENIIFPFSTGNSTMNAHHFLEQYYDDIKHIPPIKDSVLFLENFEQSSSKEHHLIMTLMPLAASFKKEHPKEDIHSIFSMTQSFALSTIERGIL
jgi:hypothetical protein